MSRYARRKDDNHADVVRWLKDMGCTVEPIDRKDVPDLIVGIFGIDQFVEVKPDVGVKARRELREGQEDFAANWKGRKPVVVRNLDDCAALVARLRGALTRNEVHAAPQEQPCTTP